MSDDEIDACIWPGLIDCLNDPFDAVGNGDDFSSCYVDLRKFARAVLAANANKTNLSSNANSASDV